MNSTHGLDMNFASFAGQGLGIQGACFDRRMGSRQACLPCAWLPVKVWLLTMPDWMNDVVRAALSTVRPSIAQRMAFSMAWSTVVLEQSYLTCVHIPGKVCLVSVSASIKGWYC
jgi:hypothetical protein